jgi:hypothetical protein
MRIGGHGMGGGGGSRGVCGSERRRGRGTRVCGDSVGIL